MHPKLKKLFEEATATYSVRLAKTDTYVDRVFIDADGEENPVAIIRRKFTDRQDNLRRAQLLTLGANHLERLVETLEDIELRAKRIREDKAVVGVEAFYIADIARAALTALEKDLED